MAMPDAMQIKLAPPVNLLCNGLTVNKRLRSTQEGLDASSSLILWDQPHKYSSESMDVPSMLHLLKGYCTR